MKKLLYYAFAMMTTLFTMTSCDTDQQIANYLINGNWKGSLDTYYTNRWGDEFLDGEFYTVWRFDGGVYDSYGYVTSGIGYEVDYNIYDEREYAYSSFRWEVNNGNIYIYYDAPGSVSMYIAPSAGKSTTATSTSITMLPDGTMYVSTGATTLSAQAVSAGRCTTGKTASMTSTWTTSAIGIGITTVMAEVALAERLTTTTPTSATMAAVLLQAASPRPSRK